ncbi:MAG: hypothetical protein GX946_06420, partial [Oligosphaeraceae bacterium]|nr:hypothetical protein [Oligosphaeraceae bacterium]
MTYAMRQRSIQVGNKMIGKGHRIFLTGEIGVAHGGNMENAKLLIRSAADAGCDGAEMFMTDVEEFYWRNPPNGRDFFQEWPAESFTFEQWRELIDFGKSLDLIVYPTPLDFHAVQWCKDLNVDMININSDDLNNVLLLEEVAKLGCPISMHDIDQSLSEVEGAVRTLLDNGAKDIIVLHSTMETDDTEFAYATANLNVMKTYEQAFGDLGVMAGCVEHTTSDYLIYAVAALKPALISKHIKLDDTISHDRKIAVRADELKLMVQRVRRIESALGNAHNQRVADANGIPLKRSRNKVLVAARDIAAGSVITRKDIVAKRPGDWGGLHPWMARQLIGAKAVRDLP